jgi:hypothetical protein
VHNPVSCSWAEARVKIARMTLTIKLDGNWSSFQLANSAPPLSVTDSAIAPSARINKLPGILRSEKLFEAATCLARLFHDGFCILRNSALLCRILPYTFCRNPKNAGFCNIYIPESAIYSLQDAPRYAGFCIMKAEHSAILQDSAIDILHHAGFC